MGMAAALLHLAHGVVTPTFAQSVLQTTAIGAVYDRVRGILPGARKPEPPPVPFAWKIDPAQFVMPRFDTPAFPPPRHKPVFIDITTVHLSRGSYTPPPTHAASSAPRSSPWPRVSEEKPVDVLANARRLPYTPARQIAAEPLPVEQPAPVEPLSIPVEEPETFDLTNVISVPFTRRDTGATPTSSADVLVFTPKAPEPTPFVGFVEEPSEEDLVSARQLVIGTAINDLQERTIELQGLVLPTVTFDDGKVDPEIHLGDWRVTITQVYDPEED